MPMIVRCFEATGVTAYQVPIGRIILINTWLAYHFRKGVSTIPKSTSFFAIHLIFVSVRDKYWCDKPARQFMLHEVFVENE